MNYKELEQKVLELGPKRCNLEEVVKLKEIYLSILDPEKPTENTEVFSNYLSIEKFILDKYTNIKQQFDNLYLSLSKEQQNEFRENNPFDKSIFFMNDILAVKSLVNKLEEIQYNV